ncbi:MAG: hypothetical protein CMF50_03645 [Legionellales bacterium]|nr:hypothetical protein [Legionellales bacterium]|tara:strand:+ start:3551 stop:4045 length:495 start_codon:yes stop_codon:yes gene_type:complete
MNFSPTITTFKKIIIVFWALWWLIALWTDIVGAFAQLGLLHASWAPNGNYPFLVESLQMYNVPSWVPAVLFVGILLWSTLSAASFTWAACSLSQPQAVWMERAHTAFIITLTYWLAFFLADQLVMKFDLEQNHMVQGGFQLLSFMVLFISASSEESRPAVEQTS